MLTGLSAPIAGWFWTVGHMAGPAAVVYLWFDGRRRCKEAASVPLAATIPGRGTRASTWVPGISRASWSVWKAARFEGRSTRFRASPIPYKQSPAI